MTKGLREQGTNCLARGGWFTLIAVFSVSPEKQWKTTRIKRESLDYRRNCFVYTAEKALLNTQETNDI
jgi:hypothetical protein